MVPINYVDPPDIPEGLTIREWRARQRAARDGQRPPASGDAGAAGSATHGEPNSTARVMRAASARRPHEVVHVVPPDR